MKHVIRSLLLTVCGLSAAAGDEVVLTKNPETVKVTIDGQVFAVYQFGPQYKKPFFSTVTAPGSMDLLTSEMQQEPADEFAAGNRVVVAQENAELHAEGKIAGRAMLGEELVVSKSQEGRLFVPDKNAWIQQADVAPLKAIVTRIVDPDPPKIGDRKHPQYYDHPHHKGIWLSIDEVNEIEFWAEDGRIENQSVELLTPSGDPAVMKVINHWQGEDGEPVLIEESTIRIFSNRLFVYDITFTAGEKEATFGDTKEGLFAIRLPNSMREFVANGPVVNAEGVQGTKEMWGRPSPWIDYAGPIGEHLFGVTIMDDPRNFRPSRYHVRDYGLFAINPFGEKAYTNGMQDAPPVTLAPGESLDLRYGLYVHAGDAGEGKVPQTYEEFTNLER